MKSDKDMGSILGPELKIDGNVNVSGSLLIYGTVNGNIESKGSVRISIAAETLFLPFHSSRSAGVTPATFIPPTEKAAYFRLDLSTINATTVGERPRASKMNT